MNYVKCNLCGADDYVILNSHYNDKYCKPGVEVRNVICKRCGLVYINPQADRDDLDAMYSGTYAGVRDGAPDEGYLIGKDACAEYRAGWIIKHSGGRPSGKVLEVGCAAGNLLNAFNKRGWEAYGVEPTSHYAQFAREHYGLNVFEGFLEDIKFPESSFDLVVMAQTLEHFSDPAGALQIINRLLKKGGFIHIDVPNVTKPNKLKLSNYFVSPHLYSFSPVTLSLLLMRTGYTPIAKDDNHHLYILAENTKEPIHIDFVKQGQSYAKIASGLTFRHRFMTQLLFQTKRIITNAILDVAGKSKGFEIIKNISRFKRRLGSLLVKRQGGQY